MMKRIISLVLCLGMIAGALLMAGCEADTGTPSSDDTLPMTLSFLGITEESTTPEAIEATEEALNRIFKTEFKTKIDLTLVTADEYIALVEERVAEAEASALRLAAINKYNSLQQNIANTQSANNSNDNKGLFGKWAQSAKIVEASTLSTGTEYTAEQTTVYADGKIETVYPAATSPIDILMIDGKEMYDYLDEKGYLLSVSNLIETEFTKFNQYIYPTFFDQLQTITGDIKAIPNNNLLAEYTYLVVDKALADELDFDVDAVESYDDLNAGECGFLAQVAAKGDVTVMATEPEALGIYTYFEGDNAVGTYMNPIYGYDPAEGTDFTIRNLFDIPEYTNHLVLMDEYRKAGYFDNKGDKFAVDVVKGNASLPAAYGDDYYVKVLQNPFVEMSAVFDGMLAVYEGSADEKRALQIIQAINTDPEVKNILQYGIAYDGDNEEVANYNINEIENEDGTISLSITRRNQTYMMDNRLTGNVYMGYPEEGQTIDIWDYYKQTNLDSALSPFMYFYVGNSGLDSMLSQILRRACMTEVLDPLDIDYNVYEETSGTPQGSELRREFKSAYIEYFVGCLEADGNATSVPLDFITKGEGSALDQDFIEFVLSKEGQDILASIGYTKIKKNAMPYEKKASMSGKIGIMPGTGTNLISYVEPLMTKLSEAYKAMYPEVEFSFYTRDPNYGYNGNLTQLGSAYTIGILNRELTAAEANAGLEETHVGKSFLDIFNSESNAVYSTMWYENQMISKITAEKYADIVSASDLKAMVQNKIAELAGIKLTAYPLANRPASESVVLANAAKNAANYYTNIDYLRVMADELLFDDAESAQYANLKGAEYENAVFEYVRKNYETENNLTEEDYVKRVQDFMASVLVYTSKEDKSQKYSVSWDEFQETKQNAQVYIEAATKIKDAYYDKLTTKVSAGLLQLYSLTEVIDLVYDVMYEEYLADNGLDKAEFEASIREKYLGKVGSSAEEFDSYSKTSDEYKNTCSNLRKEYKKLLVAEYGKPTYDKGESGISNAEMLNFLFSHFLEETIQVNDKMCEMADIDFETFDAASVHMDNYDMYVSTMKTMYVYTLRAAGYTSYQIDNWTYEEAETKIYDILYETGFYTNELAEYIGLTLSNYMLSKSDAATYLNYMNNLVAALAPELTAKGYNTTELLKEKGSVIEEACYDIVLEKYFSDKITVEDVVYDVSAEYIAGVENATDLPAYIADAKEATGNDYFFMAVVNSLQSAWDEQKAES